MSRPPPPGPHGPGGPAPAPAVAQESGPKRRRRAHLRRKTAAGAAPRTPFYFLLQEWRRELRAEGVAEGEDAGFSVEAICEAAGEQWRSMEPEERRVYEDMAK